MPESLPGFLLLFLVPYAALCVVSTYLTGPWRRR
jgi:hypothetical protein